MVTFVNTVRNSFWSDSFWLPPNITWADVAPKIGDGINRVDYRHVLCPLAMTVPLLFIRFLFEK